MDRGSWHKFSSPILCRNDLVKGAGHCSIVKSEEGILVFFHAWEKDETVIEWNRVAAWCGKLSVKDGKFTIE